MPAVAECVAVCQGVLAVAQAEHLGHLPRTLVLRLDVEVLDERVLQKGLDLVSVHHRRVERLQHALEERQRLVAPAALHAAADGLRATAQLSE